MRPDARRMGELGNRNPVCSRRGKVGLRLPCVAVPLVVLVAVMTVVAMLPVPSARAADAPSTTAATPTVFFRQTSGGLAQQADITFASVPGREVVVTVGLNGRSIATKVAGDALTARVGVPDTDRPGTAAFSVDGGPAFTQAWKPQRKWDLWLMPTTHIDLYSTANYAYTPGQHMAVMETALDLLDANPDYRFQIENTLPLEELLVLRPQLKARLAAALASGRMAVGAQYTGVHQAETSDESLIQGQYAYEGGRRAMDELGVKPNAAIVFDAPSVTLQLPQVARQAGVRYFLFSPNHSYRFYERLRLPWLFRWKAPDGTSVLTWRSAWNYTYEKNQYYNLQGSTQAAAEARVAQMLTDRQTGVFRNPYGEANPPDPNLHYPFSDLFVIWDYGDNTAANAEPIEFAHRWNSQWSYPRFRMSTFSEFMGHMESEYEPSMIPERSGEVLDAWTFIVMNQALLNEFTRRAQRDLPAAATWSSLGALLGGPAYPSERMRRAWSDIGKVEAHDWFYGAFPLAEATGLPLPNSNLPLPFGAGENNVPAFMIPDLDKAGWASDAESSARSMAISAGEAFAGLIASEGDEVVVLNNGTEKRSDLISIPATAKHVIDEVTGQEVPAQTVSGAAWATGLGARPIMAIHADQDLAAQETGDVTVFVAPDVPGLGYKRFKLSDSPGRPAPPASSPYELSFDLATGAISSIRRGGRELVDSSAPWKLGELLLGLPATDFGDIFDEPQPVKNVLQQLTGLSMKVFLGGFPGAALPAQCGAVFCETRAAGAFADEHRTMSVYTYPRLDRVDLVISTTFTKVKQERFVLSMPLAGSIEEIHYSEPFAIHRVGRDEAPSEPSVHRQLTDWIEVGDGHGNATAVSSPDVGPFTLGRPDVNLMTDQFTKPDHPWYYPVVMDTDAGGLVSLGTYVTRFSLAAGSPGVGSRLAVSEREPLRAVVMGKQQGLLRDEAASLIRVSGGRVTAVKAAREGDGLIVRVLAAGGRLAVEPNKALGLGRPRRATIGEVPYGSVTEEVSARPFEIVTLYFPKSMKGSATAVHGDSRGLLPATGAASSLPLALVAGLLLLLGAARAWTVHPGGKN
ncbi:MAG: hypothetical protein WDA71_08085 [Actinomycetota bacterium]